METLQHIVLSDELICLSKSLFFVFDRDKTGILSNTDFTFCIPGSFWVIVAGDSEVVSV